MIVTITIYKITTTYANLNYIQLLNRKIIRNQFINLVSTCQFKLFDEFFRDLSKSPTNIADRVTFEFHVPETDANEM